jgi:hypothetical protein
MVLANLLLAVLIVEVWFVGKLLNQSFLAMGKDLENITRFLVEIRNAVLKQKPEDSPLREQPADKTPPPVG